jgi:hypothetical protein
MTLGDGGQSKIHRYQQDATMADAAAKAVRDYWAAGR